MSNVSKQYGPHHTIPLMEYGSDRHMLVPEVANEVIQVINRLIRAEIVEGPTSQVVPSDNRFTFVIKRSAAGTVNTVDDIFYPFKIYVFPSEQRATPDANNDWRKFRVRNGVVIGNILSPVNPSGTDGAAIPEHFSVSESDMADVVVPDGTTEYWFWLDIDEGTNSATVNHGLPAARPASWSITTFPIGVVDTSSYSESKRALIRQYVRTDVIIPCLSFTP
jgi:hypothetical protein